MRSRLVLGLAVSLAAAPAAAGNSPAVDLQLFQPAPGGTDFITVNSGEVAPHLSLSAGVNLNYGHKLLEVLALEPGGLTQPVGSVVRHRVDLVLMGAIGLFGRAELGVAMPLVVESGFDAGNFQSQSLDLGTNALRQATQGDLRLVPKISLFALDGNVLALALVPTVTLPTSGKAPFAGESSVTAAPALALSGRPTSFLRLGLDLGYRWRKPATIGTVTVGQEAFFRAAVGLDPSLGQGGPVEIVAEAFGNTPLKHPFGSGLSGTQATYARAATPVEGDISLRLHFGSLAFAVGAGGGLRPGYGAPLPRVFVSAGYFSANAILPDADKDGIPDESDKCPDKPEDKDGFEDADGCPDLDNDKDGVVDEDDQCPMEPEDKDGFEDEDGCPDLDNDKDGVPDETDKCPLQPEDKDGFEDEDGCPDLDNDKDGIPDALDKCPNEAEDMDGFEDEDGCPELDNDKDGLPDLNDLCPNYPEDKDGFADDDGCPEDNDNDGIPDAQDKCPNEPETYNGIKDDDGCPDAAEKKSQVAVTEDKIEIKEAVFFKATSAVIQPRSFDLLGQVVAVLRNYKHITRVRVEGHTDNQGPRKKNLKLSADRADAVRAFLVAHGIEADRLEAQGFGPDRPVASNKTPAGREQNRRVEFVIVSQRPIGEEVKPQVVETQIQMDLPGGAAPAPDAAAPLLPAAPDAAPPAPAPDAAAPAPLLDLGGDAGPGAAGKRGRGGASRPAKPGKKAKKKKGGDIQFGF